MIQEMTMHYIENLVFNYVLAGIIGWIVWYLVALIYVIASFGTNLSMYRTTKEVKNKKWSLADILGIIAWPWGMLDQTYKLVKHVKLRLSREE
jgi:hypothetical protein